MAIHGRPATTVDLSEMLRLLKEETKTLVPITRKEAIVVYEEIQTLRAKLAAANERVDAAWEFALFLTDFMETTEPSA